MRNEIVVAVVGARMPGRFSVKVSIPIAGEAKSGPYMYIDAQSYDKAQKMADDIAATLRENSDAEKVTRR